MRLNSADRENGLTLLGLKGSRERACRQGGAQWVGVRADHGVVGKGRWAFCVWNETGGNLRIGWSCAEASLKLGTDAWSFGYGGTATKSHKNQFTKYGQTYGKNDAITCLLDLDRNAIMYMKNGREIPGDAFQLDRDMSGWALFPHIYTKEATFAVSFDGEGGAPPLQGGFRWIASADRALVPSPLKPKGAAHGPVADKWAKDSQKEGGSGFVLTAYGWRTEKEAGKDAIGTQEWRNALDAYVRHFTQLLEAEYEAERQDVVERVKRRSLGQLEADGVGIGGLSASIDKESGRVSLWSDTRHLPYMAEISIGRTVLLSSVDAGLDLEDTSKTISGEVESMRDTEWVLSTQYERLPRQGSRVMYRVDLGPNIIAYKRIDRMLDELQRCLGTAQAKAPRDAIQKLNYNQNLTGLLLPGAPLANALYADISESSAAAAKWDPQSRPKPNAAADVSKAAREKDTGAARYAVKGEVPKMYKPKLNQSQSEAARLVLDQRRRFTLIQGPPGTGKTTTAVNIICGWLRTGRGPILATAFSNRGTDNLAESLDNLGVRVLRMGLCSPEMSYSLDCRLSECGAKRGEKGLKAVMQTIDVVCATCIGCGMGPLDKYTFPYIIVDEAAQVIEPAVIVPLGKGAIQAVQVGDQCQLPATVLSQEAQKGGLDISMFDRLLSMGMEVKMLAEQYRMHPKIAAFPSWRFYRDELLSAVSESSRQLPSRLPLKAPSTFIHVEASEQTGGSSKKNVKEAACISWLVKTILETLPSRLSGDEVGIITPYSAQVGEIRRALPGHVKSFVQVASVDAFQGCEKDFIIFSLVRANQRGDVGFVADWRRINVALTRARKLCVLVGHLPTWLASESELIRDWLSYHTEDTCDMRAFSPVFSALSPLPTQLYVSVVALRDEFTTKQPEPQALPRVSIAAKSSTAASKSKLWALEKAVVDAVSTGDEEVLQKTLNHATEAGIQNSTIEEAESTLAQMIATKELEFAINSAEEEVVVQAALDYAKDVQAAVQQELIDKAEDKLKRLIAIRELKEAADSKDVQLLQQALAQAKSSKIEAKRVKEAESLLSRLKASDALAQAASADESVPDYQKTLREAIESARGAGVETESVQAAEVHLRSFVRSTAELALLAAKEGDDEDVLREAVGKATEAEVAGDVIEAGKSRLKVLAATRALDTATQGADALALQAALRAARDADVDPQQVAAGEVTLRRLTEEQLAQAMGGDDVSALRQAISGAKDGGVDAEALEAAEAALQQLTCAEVLIEACNSSNEVQLRAALDAAREQGVKVSVLQKGEAKLSALAARKQLIDARELIIALEMTGSVTEEDEADFQTALKRAKDADVDDKTIAESASILRRIQCMRQICDALQSDDEKMLQEAVGAARAAGVAPSSLAAANERLERLAATQALAEAASAEDGVALGVALAAARAHGVDPANIKAAESQLAMVFSGCTGEADEGKVSENTGQELTKDDQVSDHTNPAKRRKIDPSLSGGKGEPMHQWSVCLFETALLNCRKRKAVDNEDFDLAHVLKKCQVGATSRLEAAKQSYLQSTSSSSSSSGSLDQAGLAKELEELERRKQKAVEEEDFDLAAELKAKQRALEQQSVTAAPGRDVSSDVKSELEQVRSQKREAVEAEDFGRASELRKLELELEQRLSTGNATSSGQVSTAPGADTASRAAQGALQLLTSQGFEALISACDPEVADCADGAGPDLREAVSAELRAVATTPA